MCPGIGGLFHPTRIVCRGLESNGFVLIQSVLNDDDVVTILISEMMFISIVWRPSDACQQMVEKAGSKMLLEDFYQ